MLLSPLLQKTMTVALALPVFVLANSSYADCSPESSRAESAVGQPGAIVLERKPAVRPEAVHGQMPEQPDVANGRLSRRAFYGDQPPVALTDL